MRVKKFLVQIISEDENMWHVTDEEICEHWPDLLWEYFPGQCSGPIPEIVVIPVEREGVIVPTDVERNGEQGGYP